MPGKGKSVKVRKVFPCVRMLAAGNIDGEVHCSSLLQASVTLRQVLRVFHTDLKARLSFFFFSVSFVVVVIICFVLYCFETGSLAQAGLQFPGCKDDLTLLIVLPPPVPCWDYRHAWPPTIYTMLEMEPRASCVLGDPSTSCSASPALFVLLSLLDLN